MEKRIFELLLAISVFFTLNIILRGQQDFPLVPENEAQRLYHAEYDHINGWLDQRLSETVEERSAYWADADLSSLENYESSIAAKREQFGRLLGIPEMEDLPLDPERELLFENENLRIESVTLTALPGLRVQGYLIRPATLTDSVASVLCVHGNGGSAIRTAGIDGGSDTKRDYGRLLAERGYVTFSPGMSGLFTDQTDPRPDQKHWGRDILHKKAEMLGWSITGIDVLRYQRCLDFLETLKEVDADRMGVFGISRGGEFALHLAAYDIRMKASVSIGWFNDRLKKNTILPGDAPSPMYFIIRPGRDEYYHPDMPRYFGDAELGWLTAPRAIMIQNGLQDKNMYAPHAHPEFEKLHTRYKELGIPERAVLDLPDVGHTVSTTNSFPFLDRWLNHTPTVNNE